ncbi:LuxR C-terminal-related transcriptional regulator [Candidatus Leptofilum sp.]|uniref:LuxR C-terminal-related transcriptional regulator n=1 Tax=Candidatus Leptofilum sp. TaxID=3241576 RepID=UPI003B5BE9F6
MADFVLRTKLFRPNSPHHLVTRPPLLTRLNDGLHGRLTLVSAPAGFGKTTIVATWFEQIDSAWKTAWLTLDETDDIPFRFFAHLLTAIQQIDVSLGQSAFQMLNEAQAAELRLILSALLNDLADSAHKIALALDEYHLMTDAAIHDGIHFLLDNAPPNLHLVLICRADPPFSLARLRSHRLMTEIRQHNLRFARHDAAAFLNKLLKLELTPNAVETLVTRTEGWAAGLQMAALSLQGRSDRDRFIADFSGSNRYVFDFLAEEVLAQSPANSRDFLLQTSVLDRFCSTLCDAVLQDETQSSASVIEMLEASNHFLIPLDDERRWYRYHNLFADLLRQQLRQEMPEQERELHSRASVWFEKEGIAESAIKHALSAESEDAIRLMTLYGSRWLAHGEIIRILTWVKQLPTAWRYRNPQLTEITAWAQLFRENEHDVEATLAHLPDNASNSISKQVIRGSMALRRGDMAQTIALSQDVLAAFDDHAASRQMMQMRTSATLNLAYAYRGQGDADRALPAFEQAGALSEQLDNVFTKLYAMLGQGNTLVEVGRLHEAEQVFLQGIAFANGLPTVAPIHTALGQLYYQWNRLDSAETQLEIAAELLKASGIANRSEGALALVKLRLAQNRPNAIPPLIEQLEQLRAIANTPHARQSLAVTIAEIALAQGADGLTLEQNLRELRTFSADLQSGSRLQTLTIARLLMAVERPEEALPILEALPVGQDVRIALCLCHHALGDGELAEELLREVVVSAEKSGAIRLFLDAGDPLRHLLTQLDNPPPYTATILAAFPTYVSPASPPKTQLTARETEVLRLIAQGMTNKEIAARLVIAPSTAKRHTANLYNKLGVANRAEATTLAHRLGIL